MRVGGEQAGAALDAVHFVALVEQQLAQARAVLAGHASDEGDFGWGGLDHGWVRNGGYAAIRSKEKLLSSARAVACSSVMAST